MVEVVHVVGLARRGLEVLFDFGFVHGYAEEAAGLGSACSEAEAALEAAGPAAVSLQFGDVGGAAAASGLVGVYAEAAALLGCVEQAVHRREFALGDGTPVLRFDLARDAVHAGDHVGVGPLVVGEERAVDAEYGLSERSGAVVLRGLHQGGAVPLEQGVGLGSGGVVGGA